jgi:hypothetical protein
LTCPFVRVSSNPSIVPEAVGPGEALALLERIVPHKRYAFWPDDLSFPNKPVPTELLVSHRLSRSWYYSTAALAERGVGYRYNVEIQRCRTIHHQGKLVTFDRGVAALLPTAAANTTAGMTQANRTFHVIAGNSSESCIAY